MSNTDYGSPSGNLERFARDGGFLIEETAPGERKPLFEFVTMPELMSRDYRTVYLCNGVLAKGQPAIIGGPQKSFKTSLALELAVCLATGLDFLGHFGVQVPVKVCYFSGEGGLEVIQDTLRRIGQARDVDISQIDNLVVTDRVPRLDNMAHLEAVREYIEQHRPDVIFADPLYLALCGADTSNVFSMGERLRELNEICLPYDCTPVLLHHLRKTRSNAYAPASLEDLSMAGFAEYAGQWMLLSRRTAYDPDDPTHRLWVTLGGRTGHGSQWGLDVYEGLYDSEEGRVWQPQLLRQDEIQTQMRGALTEKRIAKEHAKEAEFESLCRRAQSWIGGKQDGTTKRQVRSKFRVSADKVDQIIMHLEEEGNIEPCTVMIKAGSGERESAGYKATDQVQELF